MIIKSLLKNKFMKKIVFPASAVFMVVIMGSCKKIPLTELSSLSSTKSSVGASLNHQPQSIALTTINLGVAGNFEIL